MRALFVRISNNAKLGPMASSIIERTSCWTECAFFKNGCYAEAGPLGFFHWSRVNAGTAGRDWTSFCAQIAEEIGPRKLWRYAQAGDLPGEGPAIDRDMLQQLITANARRPVIAYTHKPVLGRGQPAKNRALIADAASKGFLINLSANNPAHADLLADLRVAPVVTVLDQAYARQAFRRRSHKRTHRPKDEWSETTAEWRDRTATLPRYTPGGRRIAVCPATYSATTCESCGACARPRGDVVIGFPAHGGAGVLQRAQAVTASYQETGHERRSASHALGS